MTEEIKKLLIVGGVAGGVSCASRARLLSESCKIAVFKRGPYVSFTNCGLPYYVGKVITDKKSLLVASPDLFSGWFNIKVRTQSNVLSIDKEEKRIEVKDLSTGRTYWEEYDVLVLAPGSTPIRPNLEGIGLPGFFTMKNISGGYLTYLAERNET